MTETAVAVPESQDFVLSSLSPSLAQKRLALGIVLFLFVVRSELQKHGVSVHAEPNELLPQVDGDRSQLQQVLLNLVTNAIDSMAATNAVRVLRVKSKVDDSGGLIVSVEDTGAGIDPKDIDRYSIRFSRQNPKAWGGAGDLPLDHRGVRRPAMGHAEHIPRRYLSIHTAG